MDFFTSGGVILASAFERFTERAGYHLCETNLRHWPKVVFKEVSVGFFLFLGIATLLSGMLVVA